MKYSQIPVDTFKQLQVEAGMILTDFDPSTGSFDRKNILCATTGGIKPDIKNDFKDFGEDIDNVKNNTKELKKITNTTATLGFSPLNFNESNLCYFMAATDKDPVTGKITPRDTLKAEDFKDIWYVGELTDGGMVAILYKNALSTDGMSIQTKKNDKAVISVTLTAHYSLYDDGDAAPVEFYISEGTDTSLSISPRTLNLVDGDVALISVMAEPDYSDVSLNMTGTGIEPSFTTDKKNIIVTATGEGEATITVTNGNLSVECNVTVSEGEG